MSLDLFEETDNVLANLRPVAEPEPGVWDNFTAGAGKVAMQTFAKAGRAASMAAAPLAMAFEKAPGSTEVQDKFFKAHDDIFGRAVDYWTPKPGEVGEAGQVVGQLLGTLPMLFASPALTVAQTQLSVAEDMARKGVDASTAQAIGATQAAGLGLGIWVPILGKTLAQRVLLGGAGFNVVQGGATRAISAQLAEGTAAEGDFKTFDPTALTLDVLLGAAFGGIAHINPRMRAEGEAWQKRLTEWGAKLKPSEVDALATLRQAQHLNADSMPGKPVDVADTNAHVDRMRQAIDDLANDRPVNVEDMPAPRFEADAARAAEANAAVKAMQDEARAEGMVLEENVLPKVSPQETARIDFDSFAKKYVEDQPVDKFEYERLLREAEADIRDDYMLGNKDSGEIFNQIRKEGAGKYFDEDGDLTDAGNRRYTELQDQAVEKEAAAQIGEPQRRAVDFADPADAANVLREYLDAAGLEPNVVGGSGKSRSKYFSIENGKRTIRISDHELPDRYVNDSDVEIILPHENDAALAKIKEVAASIVESAAPANSRELGSQAPGKAGMQDRSAVRADESGSLKEPAQSDGAGGGKGENTTSSLEVAAARFAAENPDLPMFVGKNADGSDITTTPRQWLEDADAALRQANDDVKLFEIAAGCLLGGGR